MRIPWKLRPHMTAETVARMAADAVLINGAVIIGIGARFILSVLSNSYETEHSNLFVLNESIGAYRDSGLWLTFLCLTVFWLSGFYTYGRAYMSRYKALIVGQAVSVAFLLFAALSYILPLFHPFPRSVFLTAWVVGLVFVGSARLWSYIWKRAARPQQSQHVPDSQAIRKILVIGGAGYIGSVLVRKLLDRKYDVVVLDALIYGDSGLRDLYKNPRFRFVKGDLRDVEAVVSATQGVDAVIHLGALVGDPACAIDENLTLQINLAATRVIAEVAKGYGVRRFLFASTCSVYGASDELLDEKSGLNPVSLYARSKIASENAILQLNDDDFSPTVVRFATIFGMSPRPRFDLVVNVLAARAVSEGNITIAGGDQWRPFIHVADAAEALCRCLEAPEPLVKGEIFNVGSDRENYQIGQIGELVAAAVPGVRVITDDRNPDKRNYRVSFDKLRQRIGFVPDISVRAGIHEVVQAVREGVVRDYRSSLYNNHKTLFEDGVAEQIRRDESWMALYPVSTHVESTRPNEHVEHKVLIVDDDEVTLALLQNVLADQGYQTITALNGREGITAYLGASPDVVVLDLGLPDMNGLDVLQELRRIDPEARVIIATGNTAIDADDMIRHGAIDCIRKPFHVDRFLRQVDSVVASEAGQPQRELLEVQAESISQLEKRKDGIDARDTMSLIDKSTK